MPWWFNFAWTRLPAGNTMLVFWYWRQNHRVCLGFGARDQIMTSESKSPNPGLLPVSPKRLFLLMIMMMMVRLMIPLTLAPDDWVCARIAPHRFHKHSSIFIHREAAWNSRTTLPINNVHKHSRRQSGWGSLALWHFLELNKSCLEAKLTSIRISGARSLILWKRQDAKVKNTERVPFYFWIQAGVCIVKWEAERLPFVAWVLDRVFICQSVSRTKMLTTDPITREFAVIEMPK